MIHTILAVLAVLAVQSSPSSSTSPTTARTFYSFYIVILGMNHPTVVWNPTNDPGYSKSASSWC